jgi:hypothetical protein
MPCDNCTGAPPPGSVVVKWRTYNPCNQPGGCGAAGCRSF